MRRINVVNLENLCSTINRTTDSPLVPYTKDKDGKYIANVGNYHIEGAYGGYCLSRMVNVGGGTETIIGGYMPKRELYNRMHAFLSGLEAHQANP